MKGGLVRQVHRLLSSSSTGAECRATVSFFYDGGMRRIVTVSAENSERVVEHVDKRPTIVGGSSKAAEESTAAGAPKPRWYRPDPVTGAWMPEAEIQSSTDSTDSVIVIPRPTLVTRIRAESTDASQDKTWWTSMEELPDMDRHIKDLQ